MNGQPEGAIRRRKIELVGESYAKRFQNKRDLASKLKRCETESTSAGVIFALEGKSAAE